jgi:hypothetical protein
MKGDNRVSGSRRPAKKKPGRVGARARQRANDDGTTFDCATERKTLPQKSASAARGGFPTFREKFPAQADRGRLMTTPAIVADTSWPAIVDGCSGLMAVAFGVNEANEDPVFERACHEADRSAVRQRRERQQEPRPGAPAATIEALVFSLRRGVKELGRPDTLRRLSVLNEGQLKAVCRRVQEMTESHSERELMVYLV